MQSVSPVLTVAASFTGAALGLITFWNRDSGRKGIVRPIAVLIIATVVFVIGLFSFAKALGPTRVVFAIAITLLSAAWVAALNTAVALPLPHLLRQVGATELGFLRKRWTGIPLFGRLLRNTPLRRLGGAVYLRDANGPSRVLDAIHEAETVHFWSVMVSLPWLIFWILSPALGSLLASVAIHIILNLYPLLHLRTARARLQSWITRRSPLSTGARKVPMLLLFSLLAGSPEELHSETAKWRFLDNGQVKLGVREDFGAGVGWFSTSGSERNFINSWDAGRLVQQSYYGDPDGSLWNEKPWRWNPVQGGDWRGHGATVLELRATTNSLYAKTLPKHWAAGDDLPDVIMEEWISLTGKVAHIHFKMTYHGKMTHRNASQEIPAFFAQPDLDTLVFYGGGAPWTSAPVSRSRPGWPNETRKITEHWAAYLDPHDFGVGAFVPAADHLTCYRFGDGKQEHGSCSYFAPLTEFAIEPGKVFEYDVYLTLGTGREIRERFEKIHRASSRP